MNPCSELPTQQPTRLASPANRRRRCYHGRGGREETLALLKNGRSSQRFPVRALLLVLARAAGGGEGRERVRPSSPRRLALGPSVLLRPLPARCSSCAPCCARRSIGLGRAGGFVPGAEREVSAVASTAGRFLGVCGVSFSLSVQPFCSAPFKDSRLPGVLLVSSPHLVSLVRLRFRFRFVHVFVAYLIISPLLFLS